MTTSGDAAPVEDRVLLEATVNRFDALTSWGKAARSTRLVDHGDRVAWTVDGGSPRHWALPDQEPGGRQVLARIVRAESASYSADGVRLPEVHLLLVSGDGRCLAVLGRAGYTMSDLPPESLDAMWPRAAFTALEDRGVLFEEVSTDDIGELERRFPGSVSLGRRALLSRTTYRVTFGICLVALIVALATLWSTSR